MISVPNVINKQHKLRQAVSVKLSLDRVLIGSAARVVTYFEPASACETTTDNPERSGCEFCFNECEFCFALMWSDHDSSRLSDGRTLNGAACLSEHWHSGLSIVL
jgi:hypothetical protein